MSTHTKGPWSHHNGRIFQTDYDFLTIANMARAFDGDYSPSNGDLIAAAPELLEALVLAVDADGGTTYNSEDDEVGERSCCGEVSYKPHRHYCWVVKASAAIAKAKGEQ